MEPPRVAPHVASTSTAALIHDGLLSDDDGRSSSLSDIDERLESQLDDISPRIEKVVSEIDSEAETERIEDSPSRPRDRASIVLSAGAYGTSPSKLAQSTTYDDIDDDEVNGPEASPSKPPRDLKTNGVLDTTEKSGKDSTGSHQETSKKRKREGSNTNVSGESLEDEPLRKRRSSLTADAIEEEVAVDPTIDTPETESKQNDALSNDEAQEDHADDTRLPTLKGKKGKKGKRKGKKTKDSYDINNVTGMDNDDNVVIEDQADENDNGDAINANYDPEAAFKHEERTYLDVLEGK